MKKILIAAVISALSVTAFAWSEKEQAALAGTIIGGIIGYNVQKPEIIQPAPQPIYQYQVGPQVLQPPVFDVQSNTFIYTPPLKWNYQYNHWYQPDYIYIPGNKHYYGCNFYDQIEAIRCIRYNDSLNYPRRTNREIYVYPK